MQVLNPGPHDPGDSSDSGESSEHGTLVILGTLVYLVGLVIQVTLSPVSWRKDQLMDNSFHSQKKI